MPRDIITVTTVFPYDELSDAAKIRAREALVDYLAEAGFVTGMLREVAADFLTNEGWTDLDELHEADLDKLQFAISHSQGDFVVWASERPWVFPSHNMFLFREYMVRTTIWHNNKMDVEVDFDSIHDEMPSDAQEVQARAEEMVAQTRHKLLALLHKTDLDLVDDEEYLADFATANSIEFTEDGAIYR